MGKPVFRKSPPEGVIEHIGIGTGSSAMVELADGRLAIIAGSKSISSTNCGRDWDTRSSLGCEAMGSGASLSCIKLHSGRLALAHRGKEDAGGGTEMFNWNPFYLSLSENEGKTWGSPNPMQLLGGPYQDTLIQTSTGRLIMPSRICHSNNRHPGLDYDRVSSFGHWRGLRLQVSGHYHYPEVDIASVSYSDDEGESWRQCQGQLMGWFDAEGIPNGRGGVTAVDEPSVAECADGRLMLMGRSTVGRLVQSFSEDSGETWSPILPTDLMSSYSPARLRRVPSTGDLICVWNQVSRDEIKRGYRRGRLSAAISKDSGASWEGFQTIEVSEGMEDVPRIIPQFPTSPVIGLPDLGVLPDGFATFDYPNIWFSGDQVFLHYSRSWIEADEDSQEAVTLGERHHGTAKKPREMVLRIYPLDAFYK